MTNIINLTPHAVNIIVSDDKTLEFLPSGTVARCTAETTIIGSINDIIPLTATKFGKIVDLPEEKENTMYIVSRLCLSACPDRKDLIVPNDLVRDTNGNIIGCKSFSNN